MTFSLNEVEALAKKAARGSGMSWGLAEEAGKALRGLLEHGIDATGPFACLLAANDGADYQTIAPRATNGPWTAPGGALCPIATGACLSDHAACLRSGRFIETGAIAFPIFLIPFTRNAARLLNHPVMLSWQGVAAYACGGGTLMMEGSDEAFLIPEADGVQCRIATGTSGQARPHITRAAMTEDTADRLNAMAHRTYAPATEESRLSGAGAGLSDND